MRILFLMNFNNNNYPILNNTHDYLFTKKYLSIHSEDRDVPKYPLSSKFDIELPQEYLNVVKVKLVEWSFPSNYYTFSKILKNLYMAFQISEPYNAPLLMDHASPNYPLQLAIYEGLLAHANNLFVLQIDEGFYNPTQMAAELTNRLNKTITDYLNYYFISQGVSQVIIDEFNQSYSSGELGYQEFVVFYNLVAQKLYFGNRSSRFIIPSIITPLPTEFVNEFFFLGCTFKSLPQFIDRILLFNLGFDPIPATTVTLTDQKYTRVYYEDPNTSATNGIWLTPSTDIHPNCNVSYIIPKNQINFMGPSHFYLDIIELNNMDEFNPYPLIPAISEIINDTPPNRVNSAFCKISVNSTPISQWYDRDNSAFKLFNPPLERLKKLRIRVRYHDGSLVNFGLFAYSLTLEISMFSPQQMSSLKTIHPYGI